jgi:hypothetical protein
VQVVQGLEKADGVTAVRARVAAIGKFFRMRARSNAALQRQIEAMSPKPPAGVGRQLKRSCPTR